MKAIVRGNMGKKFWCGFGLAAALILPQMGSQNLALGQTPLTPQEEKEEREVVLHAKSLSKAFRRASRIALPTVVKITARGNAPQGKPGQNPFKGTPFEDFFKDLPEGEMPSHPASGIGSGVIVDASGIVLTNNHVVAGAQELTVLLNDGREFKSSDFKTDPRTDLAIIRIKDAGNLPAAKLGDSDAMEPGEWVIAVGSPFGLDQTVSAGIISSKGRSIDGVSASDFLQTDAAINPGNSGGPLINLDGEVVGINTAIASNTGRSDGIGFAIPSNKARWIKDQLIQKGTVSRSYLGVKMYDPAVASEFGVAKGEGVLIEAVFEKTPAAEGGMKQGDVVTEISGKRVRSLRELQNLVESIPVGTKQNVKVKRDGGFVTLDIEFKAMPEKFGLQGTPVEETPVEPRDLKPATLQDLGLEVVPLDAASAQQFGYKGNVGQGVMISKVAPESLAAKNGITQGMVLARIGTKPVSKIEDLEKILAENSLKKGLLLTVTTNDGNKFVALKSP